MASVVDLAQKEFGLPNDPDLIRLIPLVEGVPELLNIGEADEIPFSFKEAVLFTFRNRAFVLFAASTVFALLAQNILMAAMPYFITVVVGGTESQMGYLLGGSLLVSLVSFPSVAKLAAQWGKARVYRISLLLGAILLSSLFLIGRFDLPISALGQTVILVGLSGLGFAPTLALPPAILADTIDYEYQTTGLRRSAMYMGIQGILQKSSMALAEQLRLRNPAADPPPRLAGIAVPFSRKFS